ncbi:MAG: M1 family metallopeptidase [Thermoplasmata archaeon]|nr:M1 family metallopeptidase [Thermoplasmata archaeon]
MIDPPGPPVRDYFLDLEVDHATLAFTGSVRIVLGEAVRELRLNSLGLEVTSETEGSRVVPNAEKEEITVELPVPASELRLTFRGRASENGLIGLYRSRYGESYILTTQCAATGTRMLFPCVDRPDRKAVVHLRLTIDEGLEAIFNTPRVGVANRNGRRTYDFAPTPAMSTYLTYLAIGRFDWLHGPEERVRVSVAAPPGRRAAGRYALERAREIVRALETYYGIPYPLPKLDLIAVPEFAYGAMENWGAISFREMRLLVDASTSGQQRKATLTTIAHEIAHQWFGNLVTMEWWTDIWLNESFATFLEEKIVEQLYPDEGALDELLLEWTTPALAGDSLPVTHPVSVPVERPEEIGQVFDEISYGKGSAVLRMIEGFVGPEAFRRGVTSYLNAHAYANATSDDLWAALETAAARPLCPILSAWIHRPGVPIVRARLDSGELRISQERFSLDGKHTPETWPIPLSVARSGEVARSLFEARDTSLGPLGPGPVHLNPGALGFYRVHYDDELYRRLLSAFPTLPPTDRWVLLQDLGAFLFSGDVPRSRYYEFLDASRSATDYLVVHELANQLSSTSPGRHPTPIGALAGDDREFREHAVGWLTAQIERLGLEPRAGEPESDAIARGRVASSLVPLDAGFASRLAARFDELGKLDPDLRWPVVLAFAGAGGATEFERIVRAIAEAASEGDANRLERALARFPQRELVARALELARTPLVNRAHLVSVVREAALNPAGREAAWAWVRTTMHAIDQEYRGTSVIGNILEWAVPYAALGHLEEARAELADRPFVEGDRGARKAIVLLEIYERFRRGAG